MKVEHPFNSVPFGDGPSSSQSVFHLVVSFPREFQGGLLVPGRESAVHVTVNVAEVELAEVRLVELEVSFLFFIDEVLVPHFHPGDSPPAEERSCFFLLCHCDPSFLRHFVCM